MSAYDGYSLVYTVHNCTNCTSHLTFTPAWGVRHLGYPRCSPQIRGSLDFPYKQQEREKSSSFAEPLTPSGLLSPPRASTMIPRSPFQRLLRNPPCRRYSAAPTPSSRLNLPIDYKSTPLLHHTASSVPHAYGLPESTTSKSLNFYQAINSALRTALSTSDKVLLFGEDVAFGGVFRCSMDLQTEFGSERVFNTPLTEQGIVGFAKIGRAHV